MGLKETTEKLKKGIEEAQEKEKEVIAAEDAELAKPLESKEEAKEEKVDPKEEKTDDKAEKEEVKTEPAKDDAKTTEEPQKKTASEAARERREKLKREEILARDLAEAKAENDRLRNEAKERAEPKKDADPEPSKLEDPQAWNEWKIRSLEKVVESTQTYQQEDARAKQHRELREAAISKLNGYEADVVRDNPDYPEAKQYYATMLATSMKMLNPALSGQRLNTAVENAMIQRAGNFLREGHENPVAAMLDEARTWGFKPTQARETEEKVTKPDLQRVAANKNRNSGMAGAAGKGGSAELTPKAAASMTNAEFARLTPSEKQRVYERLRVVGN